jgi:phosphatidate cytidylyltransferase
MLPRILTSLVGIPLLVGAIWWGPPWLTLLVVLAAVLGVHEFYRLHHRFAGASSPTQPGGPPQPDQSHRIEAEPVASPGPPLSQRVASPDLTSPREIPPSSLEEEGADVGFQSNRLPLTLGALWAMALVLGGQAASGTSNLLLISLGIILGGAFVAFLWLVAFYFGKGPVGAVLYLIAGPIYIGFPLAHALALRDWGALPEADTLGRNWLLFALLVTFATDTGAFLSGRSVGRHRMAPKISPNKTWEGAAGGLLLAVVAALALGQLLELRLPIWQQAIIGASVGVAAQLGDLVVSKLKRLAQVKDSGSIIPGHGGILDRLGSIVTSVPVVYYLVATVFNP